MTAPGRSDGEASVGWGDGSTVSVFRCGDDSGVVVTGELQAGALSPSSLLLDGDASGNVSSVVMIVGCSSVEEIASTVFGSGVVAGLTITSVVSVGSVLGLLQSGSASIVLDGDDDDDDDAGEAAGGEAVGSMTLIDVGDVVASIFVVVDVDPFSPAPKRVELSRNNVATCIGRSAAMLFTTAAGRACDSLAVLNAIGMWPALLVAKCSIP